MNPKKLFRLTLLGALISVASAQTLAALDAKDIARLGTDLTPVGAEKAGNASGSIPAWTGGLSAAPAGYNPAQDYVDPYAAEKPLYTVTAANMAQYKAELTPGYQAMLQKYPTFKMQVYPSHRSAALPQSEYAEIRKEAATVSLADNGNGMLNYQSTSVPFPIPKTGLEAIYNHMVRYRAGGYH